MTKNVLMNLRYLVSSEESRPGKGDYWNRVFLAGKTPFNRAFLETSKVALIVALSISISVIMAVF